MSDTPIADKLRLEEVSSRVTGLPDTANRLQLIADEVERLERDLAAAQSAIAAQAKEIARLREDAARLDFMIGEGCYVAHASDGECCWLMWRPNKERSFVRHKLGGFDDGRAAIDAARRALGDDK